MNSIFLDKQKPDEGDASPVRKKNGMQSFISNLIDDSKTSTDITVNLTANEVKQLQEKIASGATVLSGASNIGNTSLMDRGVYTDNKNIDVSLESVQDITDLYMVLQSACSVYMITHKEANHDLDMLVNNLKDFVEKQINIINESKRLN